MKLKEIRKQIDLIDVKILQNLAERMRFVKEAKKLKVKLGLPREDKKREQEVLNTVLRKGKKLGLSSAFIKQLFTLMIGESKRIQKND